MSNIDSLSQEERKRPRRRWFQFSLRTLIVVTAIFCILLATWIIPSERQRRAANELDRLGILYLLPGEEARNGYVWPSAEVQESRHWYDHYFKNVDSIRLSHNQAVDLSAFPYLRKFIYTHRGLDLPDNRKRILISLARHNTALVTLDIDAYLDDDELKMFSAFTQLEELELNNIYPNDASSLDAILTLKRLRGLKLWRSEISNEYLKKFDSLPNLECFGVEVSDLRPMPRLKILGEFQHVKHFSLYTPHDVTEVSMKQLLAILKESESPLYKDDVISSLIDKGQENRLKKKERILAGMRIYE